MLLGAIIDLNTLDENRLRALSHAPVTLDIAIV